MDSRTTSDRRERPIARTGLGLGALILMLAVPSHGQDLPVEIHGYGSWYYGKTDGNSYVVATEEGSYDNGQMAFSFAAPVSDRLRIFAQTDFVASSEELEVELDFALAEWKFSDAFMLRVGRVKQPFGIYTEIYDVGTLRPFDFLPQGLYGGTGFVSEGVTGASFAGTRGNRWRLGYDLYVGKLETKDDGLRIDESGAEAEEAQGILNDTVGGRFVLSTPVHGLSLGTSAYTGKTTEDDATRRSVLGFHAEYLATPWSLRGEYALQTFGEDDRGTTQAFYVEASRRLAGRWELAGRYDWFVDGAREAAESPELGEHEDIGLSLSYWFADQFVVRAGYHIATGNRFAHEGEHGDEGTGPESRTNAVTLTANFAF